MLRYKAIQILKTFNDDESKKFHMFLISPFFNKSKKVTELFDILHKKFHPNYDSEKLTNDYLLKQIKTGKLSTLKNLFADLYKLCIEYIGMEANKNKSDDFCLNLINELESRVLFNIATENIETYKEKLFSEKEFHSNIFYTLAKLELSEFNIQIFSKNAKDSNYFHKNIKHYSDVNDLFFQHYLMNLINVYIGIFRFCKFLNIEIKETEFYKSFSIFFTLEKITKYLDFKKTQGENYFTQIFELKFLFLLICVDVDKFSNSIKFIKLLKNKSDLLDIDERFDLYTVYLSWHPELSLRSDFKKYEFEFYDDYFDKKAYRSRGHEKLNLKTIYYFLVRGNGSEEFDWTKKIIEKYYDDFHPEEKDVIVAYRNFYPYLFQEKNPEKALVEISKFANHPDIQIKRDAKVFSSIIMYELKNFNSTLNHLDNLSKYLNRKDIPKIQKTFFKDFIRILKYLANQKLKQLNIETKLILEQIEKAEHMPQKNWIVEKVKIFNDE